MKNKSALLLLLVISLLISPNAGYSALDVEQIINNANNAAYYAGDDGKAQITMTISDSQGRQRTREFNILRRDSADGGEQQFYVYFKKPSDIRKMAFMVHKHIDRDDDRWLYLPALSLVKRIAASDKRTSFVGSNFYYEDVSGRLPQADAHELIEENAAYYVIKNTPRAPESVEFSSYTVWIDKSNFMPMKAEYINKNDQKYRLVEALEVKTIQGFPTVVKSRVADLLDGGETISEFSKITYNIGLDEQIFTERYLHQPPSEARK
jgi:outer membrane lipoprotein-sorting protein